MVSVNLELYEALKRSLDEEAARMIAEVVPAARDLATKDDIARLERRMDRFEHEFGQRVDKLEAKFFRWLFTMFVPLWIAVFGALVSLVVTLALKT